MPLHGKIVVMKRSGGDGTEFPLTATCLFGRKPDCDIRIQLPHVSKEHCRIDFNENKEVVLTNLSSANPTRVNGEVLLQPERLKHGDVITIHDRSFRFEYPPPRTPKKRSSTGGKVLQDQQEAVGVDTSEASTDPHLKDGTNHENIQRSLEKTLEMESKGDDNLLENKTISPFSDLYEMIKKSLDVGTPRKSSASLLQTPTSRFCTPKPGSVRKDVSKLVINTEVRDAPITDEVVSGDDQSKGCAGSLNGTPKPVKKQRRSFKCPTTEMAGGAAEEDEHSAKSSPPKRNRSTPQRFTVCEVIEHISGQSPKSPVRRRSKEASPATPAVTEPHQKEKPRNSGKAHKAVSKKRKIGELGADLLTSQMKKKRVSFGGYLSPELFDKRLPPDSPLRKGAYPTRSSCLPKPRLSLLRRASVIGCIKDGMAFGTQSPKRSPAAKNASPNNTPTPRRKSPQSKTPSPKVAKSPKSKTPSPKAASTAKKSPKSKTPSPKAATPAKKSPKSKTPSPKAATPAKKSPKSKTPSPKAASTAKKSPKSNQELPQCTGITPPSSRVPTPTVQGRFSVSRISTPSPDTQHAVSEQLPSLAITPKIPLKRTSMKSTSRKTPVSKSAAKVIRRSGISRASMKVINSWADIVKFGQTKTQVTVPAKKFVAKKATKKTVPKPRTPASKLRGHVSTGHADSPVTIVVGKAYKRKFVHPAGAAPRAVTNVALLKKDMKMDEDLTGIPEMFRTPLNERKMRSITSDNVTKTPVGSLGMSMIEPSVLTTPEEPGEMMVSPLSVASIVIDRKYNSEAVQRLLNSDEESSFVSDVPTLEMSCDAQHSTDLKTTNVTTPKQKPEAAECLTGVKRMMKTPRQKAEPVEDIRGRLLKTPKQKQEAAECLTGVKRMMKTPRQKAEPVEDIRGRLLKTPKQKQEAAECLTGVKRMMKTPRQKAEPVEDIRGRLLVTPKHKPPQLECLTGLKEIMQTPKEAADMMLVGVKDALQTPAHMQEGKDLTEKCSPVEDMAVVKTLVKTPREKGKPVEDHFGIKRLMKSPRLRGNTAVEDFEGLQELMEEPQPDSTGHTEVNEVEDHTTAVCDMGAAEELVIVQEESQDTVMSHVSQVDMTKAEADQAADNHMEGVVENIPLAAVDEHLPAQEPETVPVDHISEEHPEAEKVPDVCSVHEKKSRGRRAKVAPKATEYRAADNVEDTVPVLVRARRGRKAETAAPPGVTHKTRNRRKDVDLTMEQSTPQSPQVVFRSKRGRCAKNAPQDQAEVQQASVEADGKPSESVSVDHKADDSTASLEKPAAKPRRGRKTKQDSEQSQSTPDQDVPQADATQAVETTREEPATESLPQVEMATCTKVEAAVVKKPVRGRRARNLESKVAENEHREDVAICAPVRGRRGTKPETAQHAVRQTSRNTRSLRASSQPEETDIPGEAINDHTSSINAIQEENDSAPSQEAVVKTTKGRKTKTPVEALPDKKVANDQCLLSDAQLQQPVEKPRRGKKLQPATAEPKTLPEDTVVTAETKQPVVGAKRGRNAKREERLEKDPVEKTKAEEPVTKSRKTRKVEPMAETQPAEAGAEPEKINKPSAVAAKPRRGGRQTKGAESETPVESTVVQDAPDVRTTDRPKRGTRAKLTVESKVTAEDLMSESVSAEPSRRGRRAAAKPTVDSATGSGGQEDAKTPRRMVRWRSQVEVFNLPEETPVKALRGRKKKAGDQAEKDVNKPEEKNLSDETNQAQPAKRARRGTKVAEEAESSSKVEPETGAEAETRPKTRRGRAAKK